MLNPELESAMFASTSRVLLIGLLLGALGWADVAAADPPRNDLPMTPEQRLREEVDSLLRELQSLRTELARVRLEAETAKRELEELHQFISDHDVYGDAFEQYKSIREIAEREDRRREAEAARERREAQRLERQRRMDEARQQREADREATAEARRLREAGFRSIGMDVYLSAMAYHYAVRDVERTRVRFDPILGFYTSTDRRDQIDFSEMTISGSVVNASSETRNIGIAITFFDQRGNQVGHEIVQINNARPDVPYPFTSKLSMALNREFSSSTSYVLYADPIESGEQTNGDNGATR